MAEPGVTELATTTLRARQRVLRDNISNNNAVFRSMEQHDAVERGEDGRTILEEMFYAENGNFKRYNGADQFSLSYAPNMTAAEFEAKQFGGAIVFTGREVRMNAGDSRSIKLVSNRVKALEYTLENNLNADMLSDGTSDGGLQIGGLKYLVSKTPTTGTVGGIDRSVSGGAFYRNLKVDTTTDVPASGTATSAANIKDYWTYCIVNTTRGEDKVKLLLAGATHYRYFSSSMQAIQRIMDPKMAKGGFGSLEYEGIPVVLGGGVSFGGQSLVQADATYGLNTKFLKLRIYNNADMEPLPQTQSLNQDAEAQLVVWMGNMTMSAGKLQFVIFDS